MACTFIVVPSLGSLSRPYVAEASFFVARRSTAVVRRWHPLQVRSTKPLKCPKYHPKECTRNKHSVGRAQHTLPAPNPRIRLICSPPLKALITYSSKVCLHSRQDYITKSHTYTCKAIAKASHIIKINMGVEGVQVNK